MKSLLFMMFHIECNAIWAHKLNTKLMKCHEKIESNARFNYEASLEALDETMPEEVIVE